MQLWLKIDAKCICTIRMTLLGFKVGSFDLTNQENWWICMLSWFSRNQAAYLPKKITLLLKYCLQSLNCNSYLRSKVLVIYWINIWWRCDRNQSETVNLPSHDIIHRMPNQFAIAPPWNIHTMSPKKSRFPYAIQGSIAMQGSIWQHLV